MAKMNELKSNVYQESEISYYGWVVVGMGLLTNLVAFGIAYSFGVFLKPMASDFGWSRSVTSGAFATYAILHNLLAVIAGKLCDRFGPKVVLTFAGFCIGLSMVLMTNINTLWEFYIYYGILFSIGMAGGFAPVMSTVSRWFKAKRGLAIGLAAAGLGAGSLVFSPLIAWLISSFGWRKAYTVIGIICWVVFIPIVKFVKQVPGEFVECGELEGLSFREAFWTRDFWAYSFSWFFGAMAVWTMMIHFVPLLTDRGMPMLSAGILLGIIGATSFVGRISAGFLSDKIGRKKIMITEFSIQLVTLIWLLFSARVWMLFIFAISFGLSSGGWAGLISAIPADYFGFRATGQILGAAAIFCGVGVAIGPYIGGYIFDTTFSYNYMVILCIMATIAAIISTSLLRPVLKLRSFQ